MKIFFGICLILLLVAVALVAAIEHDPGYLLISYDVYTLETSVWIGLAGFVVLFLLIYGSFSILRRLLNQSKALNSWLSGRGYRKSQKQTALGLISFIEGNWRNSRKILAKSASKSETPLLNYLMAARASHELNDEVQMREFLKKAEESTTGSSIAVELSQAEMELSRGRYEQCLATLTRLRRSGGKYPHVLRLLKEVYEGLNDSQALLDLLPDLRRHKVLTVEQLEQLEFSASKARVDEVAKSRKNVLTELAALWKSFPKAIQFNSDITLSYAQHLIVIGEEQKAEKLIRNQLKREWHRDLINLYGRIAGEDTGKQLLYAENWQKERNSDAALFLCLGRLSLRNSLWGKAREYFEHSLKLENNAEVCTELGRLLSKLGEHEKSNEYFQQGLLLNTDSLPLLPMPDSVEVQKA
ncbi:MAG: HemY protein [Oceanicoccus sp.]|jgi:HemY protein